MANILIIEDERALERIFTLNLSRRGHNVAEADSVATADELVRAADPPFDLALLDINLPDRSGWELLRRWRERGTQGPKVIVVTAVRPSQERLMQFAPDAVLLKPFPIDSLLRLIERVLAGDPPQSATNGDVPTVGF